MATRKTQSRKPAQTATKAANKPAETSPATTGAPAGSGTATTGAPAETTPPAGSAPAEVTTGAADPMSTTRETPQEARPDATAEEIEKRKPKDDKADEATLWKMIEKGATLGEMCEATGRTSVIGTIGQIAREKGRKLVSVKPNDGTERIYVLQPKAE